MNKRNGFLLFIVIWLGDFVSTIGSGLTAFALGVYAYKLTSLASSSAMVVLFTFLPGFLVRPIGGVLADRVNRSKLMVFGNLGSAFGIGLALFTLATHVDNFAWIYPGIIISSIFFGLQNPAYKASASDYLPPDLYAKASGLLQLSSAAQFLIAPILGGLLMSWLTIQYVLVIDVATFLFAAVAVLTIGLRQNVGQKYDQSITTNFIADLLTGFKVIAANKGVLLLVGVISLLLFYIGLIQTLLTPLVLSFASEQTLGCVQSFCGLGMLVSSVFISTVNRKLKNVTILACSLGLMGLFFAFIGCRANVLAILIPGFLFFMIIPFANSSTDVLIRQTIPSDQQGRVWSLISVMTYLGAMLSYACAGFLADNIFNPLFMPGETLARKLGAFWGVGQGRGIAFIFFIAGILVMVLALLVYRSKTIWSLERAAIAPPFDASIAEVI